MAINSDADQETILSLSKADQKRLERLAALAGRTPKAMLRFVLRDGFAECEESVRASLRSDEEFERGDSYSHTEAMQTTRRLLAARGKQQD
ncbi:hypothetical protein [Pseudoduganella violacea]|uniref:Putative transcriptional regulator n=1 Tax=Pseudoduganella violacea TaxID=1715466 RepID=A0A7W5B9R3_9BURK|nr:hypothetical protein [Pseudoduganella violacea]MBB3119144.1 putative transcriptional regulator [Pseudoduganella violacea]